MKIGVVILNYNGWQDTLACVESVLGSTDAPAWVIIVDNASRDGSVRWLRHWASGAMEFTLRELGAPTSCPKPLPLVEIANGEAPPPGSVVLLCNAANKGYAAGNNAGIRLLMQWGADAVWILNNDTVVDKGALGAMRTRLFSKQRPGLCGARVCYMGTDILQCRAGGKTNPWIGLSYLDGKKSPAAEALRDAPEDVERRLNFIYGACVMASRAFLETVGLMDERYFLYNEEQDWAYSAKGQFDFAYAPDAVIWHKEGSTTGLSSHTVNARALYYLTRSRVLLTAKHMPGALPTVCLGIVFAVLRMIWRRVVIT
jgi:GT2 family glycosyltransferase